MSADCVWAGLRQTYKARNVSNGLHLQTDNVHHSLQTSAWSRHNYIYTRVNHHTHYDLAE